MALPEWVAPVNSVFAQYHVPWPVWMSIAYEESTLIPTAYNGVHPDDSYGLFQLNRKGGQGKGYTPDFLRDPVNNATIAARYIGAAFAKYGSDIAKVAVYSGHPSEDGSTPVTGVLPKRIAATYNRIKNLSIDQAVALLQSGAPGDPPGEDPPGGGGGWLPTLPTLPTADAAAQWLWELFDGLRQKIRDKVVAAGSDLAIRYGGPVAFWVLGITLIAWGLLGLSIAGGVAAIRGQLAWGRQGARLLPRGMRTAAGVATAVV